MKRSLVFLLCTIMCAFVLGLCACGSPAAPSAASQGSDSSAATETESSAGTESSTGTESSAEGSDIVEDGSEIESTSETESSSGDATQEASGSEQSAAEALSSAASGSEAAGFDFVDECTDEHGNITLYALTELKGWQVETLLDQQGYEWDESEYLWTRSSDGASFAAVNESGPYSQDTYAAMNEKGGAIAALGMQVIGGYATSEEALSGNARCVIEDSYFIDENQGIAVFYGPSMKEYLAIIGPYDEEQGTKMIMIFSQEALGSGLADEMIGSHVGGSIQEAWTAVTGEETYGN